MKAFVIVALLSATTFAAHANIVVVPSEKYCAEQKPDPKTEVGAACEKIAKEKADANKVTGAAKK